MMGKSYIVGRPTRVGVPLSVAVNGKESILLLSKLQVRLVVCVAFGELRCTTSTDDGAKTLGSQMLIRP